MSEITLPTNLKKYTGSIKVTSNGNHQVIIKHKSLKHFKTFPTRTDAEKHLKHMNVTMGLPIKNKLKLHDDYVEVGL